MEILSQAEATETAEVMVKEVCYLQNADERREMSGFLEDYEPGSLIFDLILSAYDYTDEMPYIEARPMSYYWLPSFRESFESLSYIVTRDVFGNYGIYRKVENA
jgi:hypothetical protein